MSLSIYKRLLFIATISSITAFSSFAAENDCQKIKDVQASLSSTKTQEKMQDIVDLVCSNEETTELKVAEVVEDNKIMIGGKNIEIGESSAKIKFNYSKNKTSEILVLAGEVSQKLKAGETNVTIKGNIGSKKTEDSEMALTYGGSTKLDRDINDSIIGFTVLSFSGDDVKGKQVVQGTVGVSKDWLGATRDKNLLETSISLGGQSTSYDEADSELNGITQLQLKYRSSLSDIKFLDTVGLGYLQSDNVAVKNTSWIKTTLDADFFKKREFDVTSGFDFKVSDTTTFSLEHKYNNDNMVIGGEAVTSNEAWAIIHVNYEKALNKLLK